MQLQNGLQRKDVLRLVIDNQYHTFPGNDGSYTPPRFFDKG
jgi:hypothetical protein